METFTVTIIVLGIILAFVIEALLGFSAALIAMPALLLVTNVQNAVAIMSTLLLVYSFILVKDNWQSLDRKLMIELGIGTVVGLFIGINLLKFGNPLFLKKALGIFMLFYVGYYFIKHSKIKIFQRLGLVFGVTAGTFQGLFSSGGSLYATYLNNKLDRQELIRANTIGAIALPGFLRIPLLIKENILTFDLFLISVMIIPLLFVSYLIAFKLRHRICEKTFSKMVMVILTASSFALIIG